ncbi:MAG: hypothetical protein IPH96_10830 [Saprospiraceae bacterium]|nr:hypothetical protein [Saprospiraceae bacterium]
MSDVLLSGNYVIPLKLIQYKYNFNIIQIDEAILEIVDSQNLISIFRLTLHILSKEIKQCQFQSFQ